MSSNNNGSGGGLGLGTVIFLILLILKLFGVINISWFWVFFPLLAGIALTILIVIILYLIVRK